ncbi:MAG: FAD-dependent monooxygenase [Rubrivivax sp.]
MDLTAGAASTASGSTEASKTRLAARSTEPLVIVGAGLAGSATALLLARAGQPPPLLLERTLQTEPRLCGEFVSAEAAYLLARLGVDALALGGRPTRRLRVASGKRVIEAELPFTAIGLTRRTLDSALQQQAQAAGVRLLRGQRVSIQQLGSATAPFVLQLPDAREVRTPTLLLATGKTDLAPLPRQTVREPEPLVGMRLHLQLAPAQARAIEGHVEVLLTRDGYAGLQPVEGGRVNLCLLMQRDPSKPRPADLLAALQNDCSLLAERMQGAQVMPEPPETIYRVPYGHLHRVVASDPPGLWRLGDQAAVIPSFTGDGMAIALHSATLAAQMLARNHTPGDYHRQLRADLQSQIRRAHGLYRFGRHPAGQAVMLALLERFPLLLRFIAAMTRVSPAALRM